MTKKDKIEELIAISNNMKYVAGQIQIKANLIYELGEITNFQYNKIGILLSRLDNNAKQFIKLSNELNKESQ